MTPGDKVHRIRTQVGELSVTDRGDGEPIVLWHSLFVDGASFDRVLPYISAGRRTIVIDGPDHGRSGGPNGRALYDLEACADAALEIMDALSIRGADWIGSAWGGHVGALLASRRTPKLRSLVAIGSPMQSPSGLGRIRLLVALFGWVGVRGPVASGLLGALLHPRTLSEDPEAVRYVLAAVRRPPRRGMKRAMVSLMLRRKSMVERLGRIDVPTLFITGDDPTWPLELAREHAARIPSGRAMAVPDTRHLPALERPEATGKILAEWLDEVGRGQGLR